MTLARRNRERILAAQTLTAASAPSMAAGDVPVAVYPSRVKTAAAGAKPATNAATQAGREIALRLTHDLRRLKNIKAISGKIAAKCDCFGNYQAWVDGLLAANAGVGGGIAADIAPTMMVWAIDIGEYDRALEIGAFLLKHHVTMPSRYNRDVATILVEEIADAAIAAQRRDQTFELGVLDRVDSLTIGMDMHDEVRAKLMKAIGTEHLRNGEVAEAGKAGNSLTLALTSFHMAQDLNERIGVKDKVRRATKLLKAAQTPA